MAPEVKEGMAPGQGSAWSGLWENANLHHTRAWAFSLRCDCTGAWDLGPFFVYVRLMVTDLLIILDDMHHAVPNNM
eukprot:843643-Pelagomonas_calceolata.AAC.10